MPIDDHLADPLAAAGPRREIGQAISSNAGLSLLADLGVSPTHSFRGLALSNSFRTREWSDEVNVRTTFGTKRASVPESKFALSLASRVPVEVKGTTG